VRKKDNFKNKNKKESFYNFFNFFLIKKNFFFFFFSSFPNSNFKSNNCLIFNFIIVTL